MDKVYDPSSEPDIYTLWEEAGVFTPTIDPKKEPYTIILPLPNANDPMHMGHALFTVQDILIRYHRMLGQPTLWLPGGDHAGIETQFVFEKHLAKEGKSRFDFDRDTLYSMIAAFVEENKSVNRDQMKRLGFSLDWTRYHYSLEPEIVEMVLATFRKLYDDGLVYRAERLVNYCVRCGTAFSDLEIDHQEREDALYSLDYGTIAIATARPETIFADVAVAVHPDDTRYRHLIGKTATVPITGNTVPIIADSRIVPDFGTGALKVTPAHDHLDYEIGQEHGLPSPSCIDRFGRLTGVPDAYKGLKIKAAREKIVADLAAAKLLKSTKPLTHTVSTCYRCKGMIEPILMPQWFIRTEPLAKPAIDAVKKGETVIEPLERFQKLYFDWMEGIRDWNISRQIVWGPRIPAYYCLDCNPDIELSFLDGETKHIGTWGDLKGSHTFEAVENGIQTVVAPLSARHSLDPGPCPACGGTHVIQETDTFDTWFLSSQWPVNTLKRRPGDIEYFYPTSVLDTLWDILFFWVARMMMIGIYLTGNVPFRTIHLHSRVVDGKGQKMSKSKGNVVNPIQMVDRYGADALRMALVFGAAPGSDIAVSEEKIRGMRNFTNKLWNMGRFIRMSVEEAGMDHSSIPRYMSDRHADTVRDPENRRIVSEYTMLANAVKKDLDRYRFSDAAQRLYEFAWHRLADVYLEEKKAAVKAGDGETVSVLLHVYTGILTLLHPFMPFVTETIYRQLPGWDGASILATQDFA